MKGVLYSWGGRQQGFALLEYSVPKDLPIDDDIECRVSVDRADPVFSEEYGIYALYAMKQSEK